LNEHRLIGELAAVTGPADVDVQRLHRAATLLRDDGEGEGLRDLLGAIVHDPRRAEAVAARSYWHANDFAKLVLHDNDDPPFHLRLHVWADGLIPAPRSAGYSNIHTHRWEFASVIVAGALHVELFEECDVADRKAIACHKFEYRSAEQPAAPASLVPVGRRALRSTGAIDYTVGDVHSCKVDTVHSAEPVDGALTATIFVQGPTRADSALVYQQAGRAALEDTGAMISPAEVVDLVSATLAAMARTEG
jgi:hypothetical protein